METSKSWVARQGFVYIKFRRRRVPVPWCRPGGWCGLGRWKLGLFNKLVGQFREIIFFLQSYMFCKTVFSRKGDMAQKTWKQVRIHRYRSTFGSYPRLELLFENHVDFAPLSSKNETAIHLSTCHVFHCFSSFVQILDNVHLWLIKHQLPPSFLPSNSISSTMKSVYTKTLQLPQFKTNTKWQNLGNPGIQQLFCIDLEWFRIDSFQFRLRMELYGIDLVLVYCWWIER